MYLIRQLLLFALLLFSSYSVYAGNIKHIELIDGSIISGEILSLTDGVYTVQSSSLGTLQINEADIVTIHLQTHPQKTSPPTKSSAENTELQTLQELLTQNIGAISSEKQSTDTSTASTLQALQGLMLGDKEVMGMILALQNDPKIQEILTNPSITEAAKNGDLSTLLSDPTFMKLLENPQIQAIQQKLTQ